jgi:hypothetical protein
MLFQDGRTPRHLFVFVLCTLIGASAVAQDNNCDDESREAETIRLKIKVQGNRPTHLTKGHDEADGDTVTVCRGDTIEWKTNDKEFFIEFTEETPFDGGKKKPSVGNKLVVTVSDEAQRGVSYKYDVGIKDGEILDPIMIVD